jgi:hypothetical protein
MKKLFTALLLTTLTGLVAAADFGVYGGRLFASGSQDINTVGLSVGQQFGKVGVQGTFDRSTTNAVDLDRYTVSSSYDLVKLGVAQTNVRVGYVYLDPRGATAGSSGSAGFVGAGIAYPITKQIKLVADYAYQKGNSTVKAYDGSVVTAGIKYSF